jgi:hypothetical protein
MWQPSIVQNAKLNVQFAEVQPIGNVGSAIRGSVRDLEERDAILLYIMIICLASFEATLLMCSEAKNTIGSRRLQTRKGETRNGLIIYGNPWRRRSEREFTSQSDSQFSRFFC